MAALDTRNVPDSGQFSLTGLQTEHSRHKRQKAGRYSTLDSNQLAQNIYYVRLYYYYYYYYHYYSKALSNKGGRRQGRILPALQIPTLQQILSAAV